MKKLLSLQILILMLIPQLSAATTVFKNIRSTVAGTIADSGIKSSTIERKSITYPQNCEMTYSLHSYCGDGDVANYYSQSGNLDEQKGNYATDYTLVLGYWIEPYSGPDATHVPNKDNWFAVGYDQVKLDESHVGVQIANSNFTESSTEVLKKEAERVVTLAAMMDDGDKYRMYVSPMLCNKTWTDDVEPTAGAFSRSAGMLPEGPDHPFGGQACDDTSLVSANAVPGLFTDTPTADTPCPYLPPSTSTCTYSYVYSTIIPAPGAAPTTMCSVSSSCVTAPPASTATSGGTCSGSTYAATSISGNPYPSSTADCPAGSTYTYGSAYVPPMCVCTNYVAPTPTPTPTPAPTATPVPSAGCDGTAMIVSSTNLPGPYPATSADCPAGSTYTPGGMYVPTMCYCNNYVAPTPTPAPTAAPTPVPPSISAVIAAYTATYGTDGQCSDVGSAPINATPITASTSSGHTYLYDSCAYGDYFYSVDGGAAQYVPPYVPGF